MSKQATVIIIRRPESKQLETADRRLVGRFTPRAFSRDISYIGGQFSDRVKDTVREYAETAEDEHEIAVTVVGEPAYGSGGRHENGSLTVQGTWLLKVGPPLPAEPVIEAAL